MTEIKIPGSESLSANLPGDDARPSLCLSAFWLNRIFPRWDQTWICWLGDGACRTGQQTRSTLGLLKERDATVRDLSADLLKIIARGEIQSFRSQHTLWSECRDHISTWSLWDQIEAKCGSNPYMYVFWCLNYSYLPKVLKLVFEIVSARSNNTAAVDAKSFGSSPTATSSKKCLFLLPRGWGCYCKCLATLQKRFQ